MEKHPKKETHYGKEVYVNPTTESMRKEECLCLNCGCLKPGQPDNCPIAQSFYEICVEKNIALIVTRCPLWKTELQNLLNAFLSKNPGGEEQLAREFDVSRPTITRWAKGETSPSRVMLRMVIPRLKSILQAG